jgi:hypothetical protein
VDKRELFRLATRLELLSFGLPALPKLKIKTNISTYLLVIRAWLLNHALLILVIHTFKVVI